MLNQNKPNTGDEIGIEDIAGNLLKVGDNVTLINTFLDFDGVLRWSAIIDPSTNQKITLQIKDFVYGKCIFDKLITETGTKGYSAMLLGSDVLVD